MLGYVAYSLSALVIATASEDKCVQFAQENPGINQNDLCMTHSGSPETNPFRYHCWMKDDYSMTTCEELPPPTICETIPLMESWRCSSESPYSMLCYINETSGNCQGVLSIPPKCELFSTSQCTTSYAVKKYCYEEAGVCKNRPTESPNCSNLTAECLMPPNDMFCQMDPNPPYTDCTAKPRYEDINCTRYTGSCYMQTYYCYEVWDANSNQMECKKKPAWVFSNALPENCTVDDGSDWSSSYPCKCGSATCWDSTQGFCNATASTCGGVENAFRKLKMKFDQECEANHDDDPDDKTADCKPWCEGSGKRWSKKCDWKKCSLCYPCQCADFCHQHESKDWSTKCTWNKCSLCYECMGQGLI